MSTAPRFQTVANTPDEASRMPATGDFTTFVVRLSRADSGRMDGVVERVKTGEKARFQELAAIGAVIAGMLGAGDATERPRPTDRQERER